MPVYTWYWEEEPDFMLPHAIHIVVMEVTEDSHDELCIIPVRNEYAMNIQATIRAEARAEAIVQAMSS